MPVNTEIQILASAARTATAIGADVENDDFKGVLCILDITVVPGVDTVQLVIEGKDPVSNKYFTLSQDAAQVGIGTRTVLVYPGASDGGGFISAENGVPLPETWRARVVHVGVGSFTYSLGAIHLI